MKHITQKLSILLLVLITCNNAFAQQPVVCNEVFLSIVISENYTIENYMYNKSPAVCHELFPVSSQKDTYGEVFISMNTTQKKVTMIGIKTSSEGSYDINGFQEVYKCYIVVYDNEKYAQILLDPDNITVYGTKIHIIHHNADITTTNIVTLTFQDIALSTSFASILQTYCNTKNVLYTRELAARASLYSSWSKD